MTPPAPTPTRPSALTVLTSLFERDTQEARYAYERAINTGLDTEDDPNPDLQDEDRDRWLFERAWCIALGHAIDALAASRPDGEGDGDG